MTLTYLIRREIAYRKLGFVLGLLAVILAIAGLTGARTLLRAHDARTERLIEIKEGDLREAMLRMEDDYRRIMRRLGYNVMILHRDQDLADLHARGYAIVTFPEQWAQQLAGGHIETLNHLLPVLQRRVHWPEHEHDITVTGIRGQVPLLHQRDATRSPITEPVPRNKAAIGDAIGRLLDLKPGDTFTLMGEPLAVHRRYPPRGNQDDNTIWIHLELAQRLLDAPEQINGILALECVCTPDALGKITAEVTALLPDAQVLEFSSLVTVRAQARTRAAETHRHAIDQEKTARAALRRQREQLATLLVPLAMVGSMVWIMLLTFNNARDRRTEIGILRALGMRTGQILAVFLGKALLTGLGGALIGYLLGWILGSMGGDPLPDMDLSAIRLFDPLLLFSVLLGAPLLAAAAAWAPALLAATQDPAHVLRED